MQAAARSLRLHSARKCVLPAVRCSTNDRQQHSESSASRGFGRSARPRKSPPTPKPDDALRRSLAAASGSVGRVSKGTNVVMGGEVNSIDKWNELDQKVNEYPGHRTFKAIGTGDDDFQTSMVQAVESVLGSVHPECVRSRPSSKGAYLSVTIGPCYVKNSEEVIAVYGAMKRDSRMKWFI